MYFYAFIDVRADRVVWGWGWGQFCLMESWKCPSDPWYRQSSHVGHGVLVKAFCLFFTGITLDILLESADLLLHPPYSDWLQRVALMVLLFSVLYR